jgi:hypothetical protein
MSIDGSKTWTMKNGGLCAAAINVFQYWGEQTGTMFDPFSS